MKLSLMTQNSFISQVRLARIAVFSAIFLLCLLIANGVSMVRAVDAPQLVSPANLTETTGNPLDPIIGRVLYEPLGIPTFEWTEVSGASNYHLEVATTASFESTNIFSMENIVYTTYTPNGDSELGTGFSLSESTGEFIEFSHILLARTCEGCIHKRVWKLVGGEIF